MAELWDVIDPAELTGYSRASLADRDENEFSLTRWFPNRELDDLVFEAQTGGGGLIDAANFRSYDSEPDFGSREGISSITGKLPPIARQMLLSEYDQLRLRKAPEQAYRDLLLRDGERLTRQIDARLEIARGDALVNGSVTLDERGVKATVAFSRKAEHSVTAATAWSNPAADMITDLQTWSDVWSETNGASPGAILTTKKVARAMLKNTGLQAQLYPGNSNLRLRRSDVDAWFEDNDLPPIQTYDAKVKWKGTERRILQEGRLLFLPAPAEVGSIDGGPVGETFWGTTAEAQEPQYGIQDGELPGIVVAAFKETKTPVHAITIASAIGIPIMANPNASLVANVGIS